MSVTVTNTTRDRIPTSLICQAVEATLKTLKKSGSISVVVVSSGRIRTLNRLYRGKNYITDVLSFREAEADVQTPDFLGEVIISYQRIKAQAKKFSPSIRYELAFIVIHGVLHLLGYRDETDAQALEMEKLGNKIIKKIF